MMKIKNGTFLLGDCLELMKDIPSGSVDMILCDLPYGTTACSWDSVIPFAPLWEQYWRIAKPNAAVVLTAAQPFTTLLIHSQIKHYKATWYWKKERGTNFVQAKRYPMKVIEECLIFCKNSPNYYPQFRQVKPYKHVLPRKSNSQSQHMDSESKDCNGNRIVKTYDKAYPTNLLEINRDNIFKNGSLHPTQKPVALFEYLIKTYTNEGDTVLDNCAGSGTTAIAAENTGRKWICMEQLPEYYYKAVARVYDNPPS